MVSRGGPFDLCCTTGSSNTGDQQLTGVRNDVFLLRSDNADANVKGPFDVINPPRRRNEDGMNLAAEMNALTVEERELIYEEVHGIADMIDETSELVKSSLSKMRDILESTPRRKQKALERALFLKPTMAKDDKFHLMFLRAERFDPEKAALKMQRYFDHKLELFGEDKLVKRITLDDIDENAIRSGFSQFPLVNNRGLRAQYFMCARNGHIQDWKTFTRYIWYQLMVALEDEDVQKRGVVEIVNACGEWQRPMVSMINYLRQGAHIFRDRPVRIRGFHMIYDQPSVSAFVGFLHNAVTRDLKLRERCHFGSPIELEYALMAYGIRLPQELTLVGQGIFAPAHLDEYVARRRSIEQDRARSKEEAFTKSSSNLIPYPDAKDVLMGRGFPYQSWHGNVRLNAIVEEYTENYKQVESRLSKTEMARAIVSRIQHDERGRFLQRTDVGWEPIPELAKRRKVSQLLRADWRNRLAKNKAGHEYEVDEDDEDEDEDDESHDHSAPLPTKDDKDDAGAKKDEGPAIHNVPSKRLRLS